jgi:hypothetical protein
MEPEEKRAPGRPQVYIDWKRVDELLACGCSGAEIAAEIEINDETLYIRCLRDNGILFSEYLRQKRSKGDLILKEHQYKKAIGLTDKGDNTLLIWLGKTRLKQVDAASQIASGNSFTIKVAPDGLGTGVNVSAEKVPTSDHQSPESGD